MRVAIFDIDGTLAHSTRADDRCFVRAVTEVFGISGFSTDWLAYEHQTDSGLCWELVRRHLGRDPTADECGRAEARLVALLAETVQAEPDAIREVPGAVRLFRRLEDDPGWVVAIATGSWPASAKFKLRRIGLDPDQVALASSGEAMDRCEIVKAAMRKALVRAEGRAPGARRAEPLPPLGAVYVGDGLWDLRAARRLGIGFLGVAVNGAGSLRDAGVEAIVADFADAGQVVDLLESLAQAPGER